jgi:hypothetical protein
MYMETKSVAVLVREQRRALRNCLKVFEEVSWCAEVKFSDLF